MVPRNTTVCISFNIYDCNYISYILVPTGKPQNLTGEAINSSCISLKWDHIAEEEVIGILQAYMLSYQHLGNMNSVDVGLVTSVVVCGLSVFTDYVFELKARNDAETSNVGATIALKSGESGKELMFNCCYF